MPSRSMPLRRSVPKTALRIPKRERARRRRQLKRKYGLDRRMIGVMSTIVDTKSGTAFGDYLRDVEMAMWQPCEPPKKPRAHPKFPVSTRRPKPKKRARR